MDLLSHYVARDVTRHHVLSALPDAPTQPERPPRHRGGPGSPRLLVVRTLRQLADRLEPTRPPVCSR